MTSTQLLYGLVVAPPCEWAASTDHGVDGSAAETCTANPGRRLRL